MQQEIQLRRRGRHQDQSLGLWPVLDRQQALDGLLVVRITAQAPHCFGRAGDHAAAAQRMNRRVQPQ